MKFAIFGAGGVGGYLGARLADAGHEVHLVARGDHLDVLRTEGLRVESVAGDTTVDLPATDDPAAVGPCDYVLVTVKAYDVPDVARRLDPLLDDDTAVVSFQNGVDAERRLGDEVGDDRVVGGVAYIFSTIADPGVVAHTGVEPRFIVGELDGERTARIEALHDALSACEGLEAVLSDDVRVDLWRKFAFICAHSGMTAATRLPVGELRDTEESWAMYRRLMEEVCAVARAKGTDLPDDTVDDWLAQAREMEPETYSSLHYDLTHGKRMELDALHGAVLQHAEDTSVDVPMHEAVVAILRPWAERNAGSH